MTTKRILFGIMCALLVLVVVMTGITISNIKALLQVGPPSTGATEGSQNSTSTTGATDGTTGSTDSTDGTQPPPSTDPTQTDPPPHEHAYNTVAKKVKPTCTTMGYTEYECSCGKINIDNYKDSLGHNYSVGQTISPTCTEGGYTKSVCGRCGDVTKTDETEPLGHEYDNGTAMEPTCTENAHTLIKCLNCEKTVIEDVQEDTALGHSFGAWSATEDGEYQRTCTVCGEKETSSEPDLPDDPMKITSENKENVTNDDDVYVLYIIKVGTEDEPDSYTYKILDYVDDGSLTYRYDPDLGLHIEHEDGGETIEKDLAPQQDGQYVILPSTSSPPENDPTTNPDDPTTDPDDPTIDPDEPTTDPDDPTTDPDEPTTDPDEPTTDPDEPTTDPDEPTTEPSNDSSEGQGTEPSTDSNT